VSAAGVSPIDCDPCPYESTDCISAGAGVTTESLPLLPGFWRSYEGSDFVRQCFSPDLCEGGPVANCTSGGYCDGYCAENHAGPFCELCIDGFIKAADGTCVECEGDVALSFLFPAAVVLGLLFCAVHAARHNHLQVLADAAFEAGKEGDESMMGDAAEAVQEVVSDEVKAAAVQTMHEKGKEDADENAPAFAPSTQVEEAAALTTSVASATSAILAAVMSTPPPSPPSPLSPKQVTITISRKVSEIRVPAVGELSQRIRAVAAKRGLSKKRLISLQVKVRILISLVQVLVALGVTFSIPYPPMYDSLVAYMGIFSLDLFTVMPLGCTIDYNHDHILVIRTLVPIVLLLLSFWYRRTLVKDAKHLRTEAAQELNAKRKEESFGKAKAKETLADQLLTYNFILVYLLFPSNSAAIFATFQCEELDDADHSRYLRIDFSVDCDAPFHQVMIAYAALMAFIYPIGVPLMYAYLLFYEHGTELKLLERIELRQAALREDIASAATLEKARDAEATKTERAKMHDAWERATSRASRGSARRRSSAVPEGELLQMAVSNAKEEEDTKLMLNKLMELKEEEERLHAALPDYVQKLILGYELRTYYFEIIECFRKLAIVCLPVFFQPSGSVSQLIFGLIVCFLTFGVHMVYAPYVEEGDDRIAQLCQVQIFFSLLSSIALKFDPATLRNSTNMGYLLSVLVVLPILLAFCVEIHELVYERCTAKKTGVHECMSWACCQQSKRLAHDKTKRSMAPLSRSNADARTTIGRNSAHTNGPSASSMTCSVAQCSSTRPESQSAAPRATSAADSSHTVPTAEPVDAPYDMFVSAQAASLQAKALAEKAGMGPKSPHRIKTIGTGLAFVNAAAGGKGVAATPVEDSTTAPPKRPSRMDRALAAKAKMVKGAKAAASTPSGSRFDALWQPSTSKGKMPVLPVSSTSNNFVSRQSESFSADVRRSMSDVI